MQDWMDWVGPRLCETTTTHALLQLLLQSIAFSHETRALAPAQDTRPGGVHDSHKGLAGGHPSEVACLFDGKAATARSFSQPNHVTCPVRVAATFVFSHETRTKHAFVVANVRLSL